MQSFHPGKRWGLHLPLVWVLCTEESVLYYEHLEFDIDTNYITAYRYGNHICWPKESKKKKLQYAEDATLNRDLCKILRELKIDLIGYYLARGEIEKAVEVADKMSNNRNIEKKTWWTETFTGN